MASRAKNGSETINNAEGQLKVIDGGVAHDFSASDKRGVEFIDAKITMTGTRNYLVEPAMSLEQCAQALATGAKVAHDEERDGAAAQLPAGEEGRQMLRDRMVQRAFPCAARTVRAHAHVNSVALPVLPCNSTMQARVLLTRQSRLTHLFKYSPELRSLPLTSDLRPLSFCSLRPQARVAHLKFGDSKP